MDEKKIKVVVRFIFEGKFVVFLIEIVYGFGVDVLNEGVVRRIFEVKGRFVDNFLIIYIVSIDDFEKVVREVFEKVKFFVERFWFGLFIFVFLKCEEVLLVMIGGFDIVVVRMFVYLIVFVFIRVSILLVVFLVNISGKFSLILVEYVIDDFYGKIEGIIDGGEIWVGVELMVVDFIEEFLVFLRLGGILLEELEKVIGFIRIFCG